MEDEHRPLPPGWVRQFDTIEQHQFFVDTRANPPRSIWVHPYDDPEFLETLPPSERKKHSRLHRSVTLEDLAAEDTDDETHSANPRSQPRTSGGGGASNSNTRTSTSPEPTGLHKFGRKMKDKLTSSTHTDRENARLQRAEQERRAYQAHLRARAAMLRALETGEPQFLCKDQRGRDVYVEPPPQRGPFGGYYGGRGVSHGAYGYSPYGGSGPYGNPNVRYLRPSMPYGRPMGYGYGGGIGAPVAAGFLGGAVMGGLLF